MTGFHDYEKFAFVTSEAGHLTPVHHRDLGNKCDQGLYSKNVSWADIVINEVPLEKTFEYEDSIASIESHIDNTPVKPYIVNARPCQVEFGPEEDYQSAKKWTNRLNKMNITPFTFKEAKKSKKSTEKWPVKPKSKKEVREEKTNASADKFVDMTAANDHGKLGESITLIRDADSNIVRYCPPQHWIEPHTDWESIWCEMDEISHGFKRQHRYVVDGETNKDGITGPAIYFYNEDDNDMNYSYDSDEDFIGGYRKPGPPGPPVHARAESGGRVPFCRSVM